MRISDLLWMAVKSLKGRLMVLPAAAIAISTFCLCYAGAVLLTVQQEKSLPYELEVVSDTAKLSDSILAGISGIPDVTTVTPVLEVPAGIEAGGYKAQLTLTGIDASYINETFTQGGVFPDSSAMPYIVLNEAACKLFENESGSASTEETDVPQIDWLSAAVSVQASEGAKPVVSKIVGLLSGDDKDQEPMAYIGVASAKGLLRGDGQSTDYISAKVRVENVGYAADVSEEIKKTGLSVLNANEDAELKWSMELEEMTYLIVVGAFGLLCSAFLAATRRTADVLAHKHTFSALQWIGMKKSDIKRLFALQALLTALLGIAVGTIVSVSVPSFLAPEAVGTSIFALAIPFGAAATSAAICLVCDMLPQMRRLPEPAAFSR